MDEATARARWPLDQPIALRVARNRARILEIPTYRTRGADLTTCFADVARPTILAVPSLAILNTTAIFSTEKCLQPSVFLARTQESDYIRHVRCPLRGNPQCPVGHIPRPLIPFP